jgi:CubicO group peptidase (beta-lactamase class C family)
MIARLALIAMMAVACTIGLAQQTLTAQQQKVLDSISMQDVPAGAPGMATAIVQQGKVIYERYAGYADLTDSALITKNSRFNIASNGKQFTALAVLLLVNGYKMEVGKDGTALLFSGDRLKQAKFIKEN